MKKRFLIIICLLILIVGGVGGYFTCNYIMRNDTFELVGEKVITLNLGEQYQDEGVKIISFGKDISDKVKTEDNIDYSQAGEYYIKYTVDDLIFGRIVRYRTIVISEVTP